MAMGYRVQPTGVYRGQWTGDIFKGQGTPLSVLLSLSHFSEVARYVVVPKTRYYYVPKMKIRGFSSL